MNIAEFVFKAVDGICYPTQNMNHYPDVVSVSDIAYGYEEMQKGDLYYHKDILNDGKKHPVILYIHGGGFIKGDKKCRVSISEYYAKEGYFVFCVNYRMPPEVVLPELSYDWVDAANFLVKLSEKYNIDLDNIIVTGDSSGAYTATFLEAYSCNPSIKEIMGCPELKVSFRGAMLMCGIYDMKVLLEGTKLFGVIPSTAKMIVGDFPLEDDMSNLMEYEYGEVISLTQYVNEKWCSTFMCWADDDIVCQNQGEPMAEKIKEYAPYFDSYNVGGVTNNHCFHLEFSHNKYAKECMQKSLDFLEKVFEKEEVTI